MPDFLVTVKMVTAARMNMAADSVVGSLAYAIKTYLETIDNSKTIHSISVSTLEGKAVATIVHQT